MRPTFAICATILVIVAAHLTAQDAGAGAALPPLVLGIIFALAAVADGPRDDRHR